MPEPALAQPPARVQEEEDNLELGNFFDLEVKIMCTCKCGLELEKIDGAIEQFCGACNSSFCSKCKGQPFHKDMTCVEYKYSTQNIQCRFCDERLLYPSAVQGDAFKDVCTNIDCINQCDKYCCKNKQCGHPCLGFRNEGACAVPCLHPECVAKAPEASFGLNWDSTCVICMEPFKTGYAVMKNKCGHIFHTECIKLRLETRWEPGTPVLVNFNLCPCCNQEIKFDYFPADLVKPIEDANAIYQTVKNLSMHFAKIEGLDKDERLQKEGDPLFGKLQDLALAKLAFYECFKCKIPYFGGLKDCAEGIRQLEEEKRPQPEEFQCPNCIAGGEGAGKTTCEKHGDVNVLWKCRYCCQQAVWFCWGSTHFCEPCHQYGGSGGNKPCDPETCPLLGCHPAPGREFAIGCGMCKNGFDALPEEMLTELKANY